MKKLFGLIVTALILAVGTSAHAALSVTPFVFGATLPDTTPMHTGTSVIIADLNGSFNPAVPLTGNTVLTEEVVGFAGIASSGTAAQGGPWDDGQTFPVAANLINNNQFVANTTNFWLVMFASSFNPLTQAPGQGVVYGIFNLGVYPDNTTQTPFVFAPDSFNTTTIVPEPASLALLALGGLVVAARRRKA